MRRMLDPKEAGGKLPSTIQFDENGNRTASKDVEVDGKLKLKSLVSASNPDGDITKELGGGGGATARHCYSVSVGSFIYIVNTEKNYNFTIGKQMTVSDFMTNPNYAELHAGGKSFNGYRYYPAIGTYIGSEKGTRIVKYFKLSDDHKGYVQGTSLDPKIT